MKTEEAPSAEVCLKAAGQLVKWALWFTNISQHTLCHCLQTLFSLLQQFFKKLRRVPAGLFKVAGRTDAQNSLFNEADPTSCYKVAGQVGITVLLIITLSKKFKYCSSQNGKLELLIYPLHFFSSFIFFFNFNQCSNPELSINTM